MRCFKLIHQLQRQLLGQARRFVRFLELQDEAGTYERLAQKRLRFLRADLGNEIGDGQGLLHLYFGRGIHLSLQRIQNCIGIIRHQQDGLAELFQKISIEHHHLGIGLFGFALKIGNRTVTTFGITRERDC